MDFCGLSGIPFGFCRVFCFGARWAFVHDITHKQSISMAFLIKAGSDSE